jgi:dipeptidyl aminopeptidase/acylaminoacyl peptidase
MAIWKDGDFKGIVFFQFAIGVSVGYQLDDDGSPPKVGQPFLVRVLVSILGGGFPARITLSIPDHVAMATTTPNLIYVLNTDAVLPGQLSFQYEAVGRCELATDIQVELQAFTIQDLRYPTVRLEVANAPFPNPVPEPSLGKLIFGRGSSSRLAVNSDGSGERLLDFKPTNYGVGVLSPDGTKRVSTQEQGIKNDLWVEDYGGGNAQQLTFGAVCSDPQWSFDGTKIMYSAFDGRRWVLRTIHADGSNDFETVASTSTMAIVSVNYGVFMRENRWAAISNRANNPVPQLLLGSFTASTGSPFTSVVEAITDLNPDYSYRALASTRNHDFLAMEAEDRRQPNAYEIHLWSILRGQQRIAGLSARSPCFSPDGNWIAVAKRELEYPFIGRVDINGLAEVKVSKNPPYVPPANTPIADFDPSWGAP